MTFRSGCGNTAPVHGQHAGVAALLKRLDFARLLRSQAYDLHHLGSYRKHRRRPAPENGGHEGRSGERRYAAREVQVGGALHTHCQVLVEQPQDHAQVRRPRPCQQSALKVGQIVVRHGHERLRGTELQ